MYLNKPTNSIFVGEHKRELPSEDEMRYLGRIHEECYYFQYGVNVCREKTLDAFRKSKHASDGQGFLQCKGVTDAFFKCATRGELGGTIDDIDEEARPFMLNYTNCMFRDLEPMWRCRKFFDDVLRYYVRKPGSPLKDIF